jgi:aryl-alcohol dehydrogenase-like predicted oxidoreductase
MFDFSAERTLQSVDESLQRLGLDYVDIIQVSQSMQIS